MIYSYVWYSVVYEYVKAADNDELIQLDIINSKEKLLDKDYKHRSKKYLKQEQ